MVYQESSYIKILAAFQQFWAHNILQALLPQILFSKYSLNTISIVL